MAKDSGFNLIQILNQRSREQGEGTEGKETKGKTDKKQRPKEQQVMMIDVDDLLGSNENFYQVDDSLKQSIELVGVLQPLLVDRPENGKYKVLAGHRRRLAVLSLIKEGKEQRRYVPCVYKEDGIADKLAIIMANRFREKTDWEKMTEIIEVEKLAQELKRDYGLEGRSRDITAQIMGISQAQIGRYKAIHNNLNKGLMEKFKNGIIGFSVVSELCSLSGQCQKNAERMLKENGALTLPEVKALKAEKEKEETGGKEFSIPLPIIPKPQAEPEINLPDNTEAGTGQKETERVPGGVKESAGVCQAYAGTRAEESRGDDRVLHINKETIGTESSEYVTVKCEDITGYVVKSDEECRVMVYVYPIEYPYDKTTEETCIKYVCPICEKLGKRHFLVRRTRNCPFCGVNLGWRIEGRGENK